MNEIYNNIIQSFHDDSRIIAVLLGGSRSKGIERNDSDYDLFMLIRSEKFNEFREGFSEYLERQRSINYAAEYSYVENWGYIYKAISIEHNNLTMFDFSILPFSRIEEMGIRKTNIVLFDKSGLIDEYRNNNIKSYETRDLEPKRKKDYIRLFGFEYMRFNKSCREDDYWLAYKSLDRMKTYIMRYNRIQAGVFSNAQHCPEKRYSQDFYDDSLLRKSFVIDGTYAGLKKACKSLVQLFQSMIDEKDTISFFIQTELLYK